MINAIMNVFVDTKDPADGTAVKNAILPFPVPLSYFELEVIQMCLEAQRGHVPVTHMHSLREAVSKVSLVMREIVKWEKENGR